MADLSTLLAQYDAAFDKHYAHVARFDEFKAVMKSFSWMLDQHPERFLEPNPKHVAQETRLRGITEIEVRAVETAVAGLGDEGKGPVPEIFCLVVAVDPIRHSVTLADVQRGDRNPVTRSRTKLRSNSGLARTLGHCDRGNDMARPVEANRSINQIQSGSPPGTKMRIVKPSCGLGRQLARNIPMLLLAVRSPQSPSDIRGPKNGCATFLRS
jgi:hypothetical protein